ALLIAMGHGAALAHGDEDHSQDKKPKSAARAATAAMPATAAMADPTRGAASREASSKLADGSLFVPKHVQRQLGLRTEPAQLKDLGATLELNGRVIADPAAGGRVQATQAGSVLPTGKGFPAPGRSVRKGELLATLHPIVSSLERGGQRAQQAELAAQLAIAERRAERLQQLAGSVPAREIEAAGIEVKALQQRLAAVGASVDVAQPLTAPVAGVVSAVHVVAGEVVDAKAVLFEIVDPKRLMVEALAYDPGLASRIVSAEGLAGETALRLESAGAGLQLREQALPLQFRIATSTAPIAVGQPVKVIARTAAVGRGIAVPRSALSQNAAGDSVLWVHGEAERFEPRRVRPRPLDASHVAIGEGLKAGERVVVAGATLLTQIR
ncbi:MAG: HlyD family efflux transporter periplasmic adaptor subunit, partial [Rhizobacter sp.]|nr:HlyD family efflux transporter periplasmic adaptor subunit [Rhizobacter sp.]